MAAKAAGVRGQFALELVEVYLVDLLKSETAFFLRSNPGYYKGDEIIWLIELSPDNMNLLAKRVFLKEVRAAATCNSEPVYGEPSLA